MMENDIKLGTELDDRQEKDNKKLGLTTDTINF